MGPDERIFASILAAEIGGPILGRNSWEIFSTAA